MIELLDMIAFTLSKSKQNYSVIEKECLAVVCIYNEAVLSLPPRPPISIDNRPCSTTMAVPLSHNNNWYLSVVQDYSYQGSRCHSTTWPTATWITAELVKLCSVVGIPEILHSDQGRNFESTLLHNTLEMLGVNKSHTTAYMCTILKVMV